MAFGAVGLNRLTSPVDYPIRFNPTVAFFLRRDGDGDHRLKVLFQSSRHVVEFVISEESLSVLGLIDGKRTLQEIADAIQADKSGIAAFISQLRDEKIVAAGISDRSDRLERSTQERFFNSFTSDTQEIDRFLVSLARSRVGIVGQGSLASWILHHLARVGLKRFLLIDDDTFSIANLGLHAMGRSADAGRAKVSINAEFVEAVYPDVDVETARERIASTGDLVSYAERCDLLINCADEPDIEVTNMIVSEACFSAGVPHVLCGGYDGHYSFVGPSVVPGKTACWACYVHGPSHENSVAGFELLDLNPHADQSTLSPMVGVIAAIHAQEAVRLLTGYEEPVMANFRGEFDISTYTLHRIAIEKRSDCSICGLPDEI